MEEIIVRIPFISQNTRGTITCSCTLVFDLSIIQIIEIRQNNRCLLLQWSISPRIGGQSSAQRNYYPQQEWQWVEERIERAWSQIQLFERQIPRFRLLCSLLVMYTKLKKKCWRQWQKRPYWASVIFCISDTPNELSSLLMLLYRHATFGAFNLKHSQLFP